MCPAAFCKHDRQLVWRGATGTETSAGQGWTDQLQPDTQSAACMRLQTGAGWLRTHLQRAPPPSSLPGRGAEGVAIRSGEKGSPKRYRPEHGVDSSSAPAPAAAGCSRGVHGVLRSGGAAATAIAALRSRRLSHIRRGVAGRACSLAQPPPELGVGRGTPVLAAAMLLLPTSVLEAVCRLKSVLEWQLPALSGVASSSAAWRNPAASTQHPDECWGKGAGTATTWPAHGSLPAAVWAAMSRAARAELLGFGDRESKTGGGGALIGQR